MEKLFKGHKACNDCLRKQRKRSNRIRTVSDQKRSTRSQSKAIQGHAEAEMVTDVYSEIVDEDRRLNAQKMEAEFYEKPEKEQASESALLVAALNKLSDADRAEILKKFG